MTTSVDESVLAPPKEGIDFDALPWNLNLPEEISYVHLTTTTGAWTKEHYDAASDSGTLFDSVHKYSDRTLPLTPSCTSLNYGTTIWEGLKCFRKKDGSCVVFRPDRNYARFARGAEAMCLPEPTRELFLRGVQHAIQQNSHVIPPCGDGMKLYVRPMLLGSGEQLGLYPSPEFSLLFYVSPTVSGSPRVLLGSRGDFLWLCIFDTVLIFRSPFLCKRETTSRMRLEDSICI
jgi:branched-chain amino acid aminotransferase